jgi:hypothetical protein
MTLPLFTTFCVLTIATLAVTVRRMLIVRFKGDECLHLMDPDVAMIEKQRTAAKRLEGVDVWAKALAILTLLAGLATYCAWWLGA